MGVPQFWRPNSNFRQPPRSPLGFSSTSSAPRNVLTPWAIWTDHWWKLQLPWIFQWSRICWSEVWWIRVLQENVVGSTLKIWGRRDVILYDFASGGFRWIVSLGTPAALGNDQQPTPFRPTVISMSGADARFIDATRPLQLKNRVAQWNHNFGSVRSYHRRNPIHMDHRPQSIDPPQQSTLAMSLAIFDY